MQYISIIQFSIFNYKLKKINYLYRRINVFKENASDCLQLQTFTVLQKPVEWLQFLDTVKIGQFFSKGKMYFVIKLYFASLKLHQASFIFNYNTVGIKKTTALNFLYSRGITNFKFNKREITYLNFFLNSSKVQSAKVLNGHWNQSIKSLKY